MKYLVKMRLCLLGNLAQADNPMQICMINIKTIICKLNPAREEKYMIIKLKIITRNIFIIIKNEI